MTLAHLAKHARSERLAMIIRRFIVIEQSGGFMSVAARTGRPPRLRLPVAVVVAFATLASVVTVVVAGGVPAEASITRSQVLDRAERWVNNPVPYSMSGYQDGYRTDCSGFVSMAWGADRSYTTQTLDAIATTIAKDQLRPGDALLWKNDTGDRIGHVRLFVSWADSARTEYWVYEQTPPSTQKAKYRWASTAGIYRPIRFDGIVDGPTPPAERPATGIDSVSWGANRVDLFARSGDNRLIHSYYDGGQWSTWYSPVNTVIASDPAVASWGHRRLDVFARSTHNQLVHIYFNGSSWFSETLPGTLTSGPDAVSWGPGRIDVVARGGSHQLVHWSYEQGRGWAARWDHRGGALSSDPTVASWGPGRLDIFAADDKDRLVHTYYDNSRWYGWETWSGEGALSSAPDAVSWGTGRIDVVMRNAVGRLGHVYYDNGRRSSTTYGTWRLSGPPSVTSWGPGRLDIFFPTAGRFVQYYHNATGWQTPVDRGAIPQA
jgi:hypothetical protein